MPAASCPASGTNPILNSFALSRMHRKLGSFRENATRLYRAIRKTPELASFFQLATAPHADIIAEVSVLDSLFRGGLLA
jgi:hypothetical protein